MLKNITMIRTIILLLAIGVFISCKKEKDESLAVTPENLSGRYTLTAMTGSDQQKLDQSFFPCQKDDEIELLANFTGKRYDTGIKCGGDSTAQETWELKNKDIHFFEYWGSVEKLTSKTLVLTSTYLIGFDMIDVKFTFARK